MKSNSLRKSKWGIIPPAEVICNLPELQVNDFPDVKPFEIRSLVDAGIDPASVGHVESYASPDEVERFGEVVKNLDTTTLFEKESPSADVNPSNE